jgi:hypothetical protein
MPFEADLFAVLRGADAALGTRVYPNFAPVSTQRPYVTWQQIGGPLISPLGGEASGLRLPEIQVNVWADTSKEAKRIAHAIEVAMRAAAAFRATPVGELVDDFDAEIPVHGTRQDFSCRHDA